VIESLIKQLANLISAGCNFAALVTLGVGAAAALAKSVWHWRRFTDLEFKRDVWVRFAGTLVLALEFALAADIADTAVAPNWRAIGQLAAIAAIRTVLSLSLERDIDTFGKAARKQAD
jgi:uncharacterized membrane protein